MRDRRQFDHRAQIGRVQQQLPDAAIVELEKVLERQTSEELMLGELLGAEVMRIRRQRFARLRVGDLQHLPWRFAGLHPALFIHIRAVAQISYLLGFLQSRIVPFYLSEGRRPAAIGGR